jgi:hypothetical protein
LTSPLYTYTAPSTTMDIGEHRPSIERRSSSDEKLSLAASNTVYTYHCLCSHLLLATTSPLPSLPTRQRSIDKAHIMPLPPPPSSIPTRGAPYKPMDHYGLMLSTQLDQNPEMIESDQGFEKRYLQRCGRCGLVVGYQLDWQQFEGDDGEVKEVETRSGRREDVVYLLPGGFITTTDMIKGKTPPRESISMIGLIPEVKV